MSALEVKPTQWREKAHKNPFTQHKAFQHGFDCGNMEDGRTSIIHRLSQNQLQAKVWHISTWTCIREIQPQCLSITFREMERVEAAT